MSNPTHDTTPAPGIPPRLAYKFPEAAQRLGVSRTTMYELVNEGAVRAITYGGVRRITEDELVRFVHSCAEVGE